MFISKLPDSVEIIDKEAFLNTYNICLNKFPLNLKFIGSDAFLGSSLSQTIKISKSIETIKADGLSCAFDFKKICYEGTKKDWEEKIGIEEYEENGIKLQFNSKH